MTTNRRARARSAATHGSAVAKTTTTSKGTTTTTSNGSDPVYSNNNSTTTFAKQSTSQQAWYSKAKYTNEPSPQYVPMVRPGHPAVKGHTMFRGWIVPASAQTAFGKPNPYRFTFPYNPDTVAVSNASNTDLALQPLDSVARNILAVGGSVGLTFLIDRQQEVLTNASSKYIGPGGTRNFRDFGSDYDIEFLYRVFNGVPDPGWRAAVPYSANYGFIMPTTVMVALSKTLRWYAFASGVSVQHIKLTPHMVPLISQVTLQLTTVLNNPDPNLLAADPAFNGTTSAKQQAQVNSNAAANGYTRLNNGKLITG